MKYLLDTNICIYIIKKKPQKGLEKFKQLSSGSIVIFAVSVAELEYGVYKSQQIERNNKILQEFLLPLEIIPFDQKSTNI